MRHTEGASSASAQRPYRGDPELHRAVARWLQAQGITLAERVVCAAGMPDLVTVNWDTIYEVKYQLARANLFSALGQVLLYRQCLNPAARAVIIGYATSDTFALRSIIEALGVEVLCWEDMLEG